MYTRIDAFEVNFVDSAARPEFKLEDSSGTGESRIYVGRDEEKYDEFFEFDNVEYFFTEKTDLLQYLDDAKEEYMKPSQNYAAKNLMDYYEKGVKQTNEINTKIIYFTFRKTFDRQNRYYLVLEPNRGANKESYKYIKDICLPRVTKFCFIKLEDNITHRRYIYLRPIFFNDLYSKQIEIAQIEEKEQSEEKKETSRIKQGVYRQALLRAMPFCPFTLVTDDRLLEACHIKPYRKCEEEEKYDYKNGITLTPTYHVLFDLGFISFENNGKLLVSPFLSNITKSRLNLREGEIIRIQSGSDKYLEYHRKNIFCKMPNIELSEN